MISKDGSRSTPENDEVSIAEAIKELNVRLIRSYDALSSILTLRDLLVIALDLEEENFERLEMLVSIFMSQATPHFDDLKDHLEDALELMGDRRCK